MKNSHKFIFSFVPYKTKMESNFPWIPYANVSRNKGIILEKMLSRKVESKQLRDVLKMLSWSEILWVELIGLFESQYIFNIICDFKLLLIPT